MANQVETYLTEDILPLLQEERYVTIATIDHETKGPNVNAISWICAPDEKTIRFAIDNRSRIIANVENEEKVTVTLIGSGSTFSICGNAQVLDKKIENVPLRLALIEVKVTEVRDIMFYGARITSEPKFEKIYDQEAAEKLDHQVLEAIRVKN